MMLKQATPIASLLLLFGAQGCNVSVNSGDCTVDSSYVCVDGSPGYLCTGNAVPAQPGNDCQDDGFGEWCCYAPAVDTCTPNASVGCVSSARGYSCTGNAQPEFYINAADVCSSDGAGNYCCWSSQCHFDNSVTARCGGPTGYSCTGNQTPSASTGDPNLVCSEGVQGRTGQLEYCCYTATSAPPQTSTCTQDPSVQGCQYPSYGFSCTGSDTPDTDYSNLSCSAPTQGTNATLYCCTHQ